jgi:hypothetical protein
LYLLYHVKSFSIVLCILTVDMGNLLLVIVYLLFKIRLAIMKLVFLNWSKIYHIW